MKKDKEITIFIPNLKVDSFVGFYVGKGCPSGVMTIDLYGEKRTLQVPFKKNKILKVPVKGDGTTKRSSRGFAIYTAYFKSYGSQVSQKVKIPVKKASGIFDICPYLKNSK